MTDPTAWKSPRQRHDDIRDDYVDLLRDLFRDQGRDDLTEHGRGYVRGTYEGIWRSMRLTLSEDEATALVERARGEQR